MHTSNKNESLPLFRTNFFLDIIVNAFHDFIGILAQTPLFRFEPFVTVTNMSSAIIWATNLSNVTIRVNQTSFRTCLRNAQSGFQQIWFPRTMTTEFRTTWKNDPNDRILCDAKKKVILREDVDLSAKMGSEHWFIMSVSWSANLSSVKSEKYSWKTSTSGNPLSSTASTA